MSIVRGFVEQGYFNRIQEFDPGACPVEAAALVVADWRQAGRMTVFMAGVFDLPTPNHRLGLGEARLMAGAMACGVDYATLDHDTSPDVMDRVRSVAASDAVKLMVTLDTNEGAAHSKAFRPEKGGCPKPIFGWNTRAYNLASYTVPRADGTCHPMVDFVTNHGPNACNSCEGCVSEDNALMVAQLEPNLVVVNAVSHNTIKTVLAEQARGRLARTAIGITNEHDHQFMDALLGGRVSGTAIVRRARGVNL